MKTIFPYIPGIVLLVWSLVVPPKPLVREKVPTQTAVVSVNDSAQATQTVLTFLDWLLNSKP